MELNQHAIVFEERDIEQNESDYKTMMVYTNGKRVIPTVEIGGKILINPQFSQLEKILAAET
jgi:glutaredoxin